VLKKLFPVGLCFFPNVRRCFCLDQWPSYFEKAKGCNVWDLDGKKYTDMSIMGIGTNILGYGNDEVDEGSIKYH
jgi:glutamate-1-semialdehyde aminotransferase